MFLDMYKCHDIRMRRNIEKTYTFSYISTVPQIQVMCVQCSEELFALTFSPQLRWSKNILHIHTYMYIASVLNDCAQCYPFA